MPGAYTLLVEDAKILIWELTQSANELLALYKKQGFSSDIADQFNSEKRKREYIGVRLALSALLDKEISVRYNEEGKPFLTDNSHQISISHSRNHIAVIAHPTCNIGIDIEQNSDKIQKVYKRFLSVEEQIWLSNGQNLSQLQIAWSAKEALYKIIGNEAVDFANQLQLLPFEPQKEGTLKATHIPTNKTYNLNYIQTTDYTMVYCLDK